MDEKFGNRSFRNESRTEELPKGWLTPDQERELGRRIIEENDDEARRQLVNAYASFAKSTAHKALSRARGASTLSLEDLTQEASLGLVLASQDFDYRKGSFAGYASWFMKSAIARALARARGIPVSEEIEKRLRKVYKATSALRSELNRNPTREEIAEKTGLNIDSVRSLQDLHNFGFTSLDTPVSDEKDSDPFGNAVPDDSGKLTGEQLSIAREELAHVNQKVADILNAIEAECTPMEIMAFKTVYGLSDGTHERKTLTEAAKIMGRTYQRVEQLLKSAWRKTGYGDSVEKKKDPLLPLQNRIEILEGLISAAK